MANKNLTNAKRVKNDEFYTQYGDIQKEIEAYVEYDADVFRGKGRIARGAARWFPARMKPVVKRLTSKGGQKQRVKK